MTTEAEFGRFETLTRRTRPLREKEPASDFAAGARLSPIDQYLNVTRRTRERLDQLRRLTEGWDCEQARPIDPDALELARMAAERLLRAGLSEPEVFPVPDGGVQLEWRAGPLELEVEVEPGASAVVFLCDDEQSGERIDGVLPRDESRFALALARLSGHA